MRDEPGGPDASPLGAIQGFVESVSWYWEGPTQWDCADTGDTFCDSVVTCSETNVPVGAMTLTAFANIHMVSQLLDCEQSCAKPGQFYNTLYTGIQSAGLAMLYQLGTVSSSPKLDSIGY